MLELMQHNDTRSSSSIDTIRRDATNDIRTGVSNSSKNNGASSSSTPSSSFQHELRGGSSSTPLIQRANFPSYSSPQRQKEGLERQDALSEDIPDLIPEDGASTIATTTFGFQIKPTTRAPPPPTFAICSTTVKREFISSTSALSPSPPLLKSCLKKKTTGSHTVLLAGSIRQVVKLSPARQRHRRRPTTRRRVRGVWGEVKASSSNYFESLRDDTLISIFGFLNLADLSRSSMCSRRWKYLVSHTSCLWKHVDATEFVRRAYDTFYLSSKDMKKASKLTAQALEQILQRASTNHPHCPQSLIIHGIQHRLSADDYLPSLSSLQELTLTHFDNMTDMHVHVLMVLMTASNSSSNLKKPQQLQQQQKLQLQKNRSNGNNLKRLVIEDCPLLTNASICSIASKCLRLEQLSLKGNSQMSDVRPIQDLLVFQTKPKPMKLTRRDGNKTSSSAALDSFFIRPASTNPDPPPSSRTKVTNQLAAMFAPPPPTNSTSMHETSANFATPPSPSSVAKSTNQLTSMFSPPPASNPAESNQLATMFSPPPSSHTNSELQSPLSSPLPLSSPPRAGSSSSLQSLFAPPGTSPPCKSLPKITIASRQSSRNGNTGMAIPMLGNLKRLDVRGTSVSAENLLDCFTHGHTNDSVVFWLSALQANGDGWNDQLLLQMSDRLVLDHLEKLNLSCSKGGGGMITNQGVQQAFFKEERRIQTLPKLQSLSLQGHSGITSSLIAATRTRAPNLLSLDI